MSKRPTRSKSRFVLFLIAALTFTGFAAISAPAASAATINSAAYVHNSTYQGLRTGINIKVYNADSSGDYSTHTGCYEVNYGYNALAAYYELVRTGDYVGSMKAYLGPEDSELVAMALFTRHRLLKDVVVNRSELYDGMNIINCLAPVGYQLGSLSASGASFGTNSWVDNLPMQGERSADKTVYDTNTGVGLHYDMCYKVKYGNEALAAGLDVLKNGDYNNVHYAYLNYEDSELTSLLFTARERLLGERPPRNSIWTESWGNCTT